MANRFIDKLRIFHDFGDESAEHLAALMTRPRRFAAKHDLILDGDRPGPVFVILEGWAIRYKILPSGTRQILAYLMPGDSCDPHVGLLAEMDHSIQTITPAQVATIDRPDMDAIFDHYPGVAKAMYLSQLVDEGTMRAWITSMGRRSSIERVAHLMCELYLRARNVGLIATPSLALPMSQLLLADSLGMTPVHLNRVLRELRSIEAIELARGGMVVADPEKLARIAGFDETYLHRRTRTPI